MRLCVAAPDSRFILPQIGPPGVVYIMQQHSARLSHRCLAPSRSTPTPFGKRGLFSHAQRIGHAGTEGLICRVSRAMAEAVQGSTVPVTAAPTKRFKVGVFSALPYVQDFLEKPLGEHFEAHFFDVSPSAAAAEGLRLGLGGGPALRLPACQPAPAARTCRPG